ncbi:MAG: phosphotransacetylase family protein [Armatimonadota bacterium]
MNDGHERRLFIAATSQNDGKTSCSIGLLEGLKRFASSVGFMKPVGQRYVVVGNAQVDEDAVLIQRIFGLKGAIKDMNPVSVPQYFTREYLDNPEKLHQGLVDDIQAAYVRIAHGNDLVVIEGTGHAGVGSVFDLSNAHVARLLGAKVLIITLGGIGQPIDEVALNRCLFEQEGVEVIGVIANKVLPDKMEQTRHYLSKALDRMGLPLYGVIPYTPRLTWPTIQQVADSLKAKVVNGQEDQMNNAIAEVVVGAMTPHNALNFIRDKSLLIVPGDRDDLVLAAASFDVLRDDIHISGILFTGGILPQPQTLDLLSRTHIPALSVEGPTYDAAARVHKLTVKIQVSDEEKISLAETMVREYVDVQRLWDALG